MTPPRGHSGIDSKCDHSIQGATLIIDYFSLKFRPSESAEVSNDPGTVNSLFNSSCHPCFRDIAAPPGVVLGNWGCRMWEFGNCKSVKCRVVGFAHFNAPEGTQYRLYLCNRLEDTPFLNLFPHQLIQPFCLDHGKLGARY